MSAGPMRKLASIVALDVAGYSARMEQDEAKTAAEVAALRPVIEAIGTAHGGRVFNTAGDGFMLEFASSLGAVEAAFELAERCAPPVRVGVHLGDVAVQPDGDLLGHGVNVAARLMAKSDPGGVLVSADVRRTIRGPLAQRLVSRGLIQLDKMAETIEVFAFADSRAGTPGRIPRPSQAGAQFWRKRMIVDVVPFVDMPAARDQGSFADELREEILGAITRIGSLTAVAAKLDGTAAAPYRLEGRARGAGGRLRVTLSVIEAENNTRLWTENFDSGADAGMEFQERIATTTAARVEDAMFLAEIRRADAMAAETRGPYELYLLASSLSVRWDPASVAQALGLLDEALRRDPDFSRACATAAFCRSIAFQSGWGTNLAETKRVGMELGRRALNVAESDIAVLLLFTAAEVSWGEDLSAASALLERNLARAPKDVRLHAMRGWIKAASGGHAVAALESFDTALSLDEWPAILAFVLFGRAICLLLLRDYGTAIPLLRETLALRPQYLFAQVLLAAALGHAGQTGAAHAAAAEIADKSHVPHILAIFRNAEDRGFLARGLDLAGLEMR